MKNDEFAGLGCLVTGAGRGIGRELALAFAAAGARVAVLDRDDSANAVVKEIRAAGGTAVPVMLDLADTAAIEPTLASLASSGFGAIDILVNNAAIVNPRAFLDTTPADLETVLRVNLHLALGGSFERDVYTSTRVSEPSP